MSGHRGPWRSDADEDSQDLNEAVRGALQAPNRVPPVAEDIAEKRALVEYIRDVEYGTVTKYVNGVPITYTRDD